MVEEETSWALKYKRLYEKGKNEKKDQREGKAAGTEGDRPKTIGLD